MPIDDFIETHVNPRRGGYSPNEVEQLIRAAAALVRASPTSPAADKQQDDRPVKS